MDNVIVRLADVTDLNQVARLFDLYRQFYDQQPDLNLAKNFIEDRLINNETTIFVAADINGDLVGFCQMYPTFCSVVAAPIYVLYDLFVLPTVRRGGVGRKLLIAAEKYAIDAGATRMDLTTAKTNAVAQALYESLGWDRDDVFYSYCKNIG